MKAKEFHTEIKDLINQGLTYPQISDELGLTRAQVSCYSQRFLGGNPNYINKKSKHKHLHKKILEMRLKISDKEIMQKLNLTKSEMKSCMTYAYKNKELSHLRKETRRRDSWSNKELKFLLQWSGIIPRKEINDYLKRGNSEIVIKEKLQQLGLCSKNVNGMTYSQFTSLFKTEPFFYIETSAGSPASKFAKFANWKIVPWCHIDEMIKNKDIEHTEAIETYINSMATFQRWVHGENYWKSLTRTPKFLGCVDTKK